MPQNSPGATTLTDRAIVRLSGEGVRDFLQGLVTSDVTGPLPVWAGLLNPQGKCLFDFMVWEDSQHLLLDCEAEAADDLIKRLAIYRLRRPVTIARDPSLAVHWSTDGGDDPRLPELGKRWLAPIPPRNGEGDHPEDGGGADRAYREHRLRLGVTEGRAELGDFLWLECNAVELNGVSFSKGCFVGQENTARMNWRQKVNRRLLVVDGDSDRAVARYPELGLSVAHVRVDSIPANAIIPDWLRPSLS